MSSELAAFYRGIFHDGNPMNPQDYVPIAPEGADPDVPDGVGLQ